ncbi:MAG: hypothetical protein ONB05_11680, partial [candidate division KSB1 bacterium]|nr:hypothetical protein [candidate division KSB1 bacterium]
ASYIFYLTLFVTLPLFLIHPMDFLVTLIVFLAKVLLDFLIVLKGCRMTGRTDLLKYFPLTEVLQIPYILYVGLAGLRGKFHWKGR